MKKNKTNKQRKGSNTGSKGTDYRQSNDKNLVDVREYVTVQGGK
jgi:hypothetical protein